MTRIMCPVVFLIIIFGFSISLAAFAAALIGRPPALRGYRTLRGRE